MAQTLKFGNKVWAAKEESVLAYNDINNNYKPLPFSFARASTGTRVNKDGLIETMGQDIARIDYTDSSNGVLLLEPSSTNLIPYSEDFSNSAWTKLNASVVSNNSISPDGTLNANKIIDDSTNGVHRIQDGLVTNSTGNYTYSIFLKKGTLTTAYFQVFNSTTASTANVDLENGTITSGGVGFNQKIEDYGNDWYRCSISFTSTNTATTVYLYTKQSAAYVGTGEYLYAWGAQLEQESYPTSYIPTSGSTVTRAADSCKDSGNSEVFNDSEGVLFADIAALVNDNNFKSISVSDSSISDRITLSLYQSSLFAYIAEGSVAQFNVSQAVNSISQYHKVAIKYKTNDCAFWIDGFEVATDTSATMPTGLKDLGFDKGEGPSDDFYGKTKELGYYNTALTDLELETLTSYRNWVSMVNELNLNIIYNG